MLEIDFYGMAVRQVTQRIFLVKKNVGEGSTPDLGVVRYGICITADCIDVGLAMR